MAETATGEGGPPGARVIRPMMPPHLVLRDFLSEDAVAGLFAFALANEAQFEPTKVGPIDQGKVNPKARISTAIREFAPFKQILKDKFRAAAPELTARLRATPIPEPKFELQLVAHNDGAFYRRHIDTQTASDRKILRILSGVYYFHAMPRAFSGGALRLHPIGGANDALFTDVEPEHNTLVVFPSWAPHEVMPVACPSRRFADSRFAVNCWAYRSVAPAP